MQLEHFPDGTSVSLIYTFEMRWARKRLETLMNCLEPLCVLWETSQHAPAPRQQGASGKHTLEHWVSVIPITLQWWSCLQRVTKNPPLSCLSSISFSKMPSSSQIGHLLNLYTPLAAKCWPLCYHILELLPHTVGASQVETMLSCHQGFTL